jgi:hypothetical protein
MNLEKSMVGIVYDKDGTPKVSPDWIANLTAKQRDWASKELESRGYRLTENSVEKL